MNEAEKIFPDENFLRKKIPKLINHENIDLLNEDK
jgi:hypothetical protein